MPTGCKLLPVNNRTYVGSKAKLRDPHVLPEQDHLLLRCHLETCERNRAPSWILLAHALQSKIFNTKAVPGPVARNIVVGGSLVTCSIGGDALATRLLVHQALLSILHAVAILVPSLTGATLLGKRIGQPAPLLCKYGTVKSLFLHDILPPA